ncbi:GNAT family N-acetyltransferase [Sedimentibacter sp. MB31-C6]|uniref:GNAT family N-acetyltransferase n=1 Tax=Sedimentibacter sp. MB31-C6 TaxID=3109366 RepID=UPI002DDD2F3C|nr:GNAT family N-acetyltransferase [Sedimentibacter sp. MB36-C1]WSI05169.1 GNAT family N-acetyltransferase [Sedimentibacter sp. MB36-C1]
MISTKWFQGKEESHNYIEIRKKVFNSELLIKEKITDIYDEFAFNVVIYEDEIPAGTGRLLFKEGKYFIDKVCVLKEFRDNNYSDLIIRMLIRKAVNIGADKTYAMIQNEYIKIFEKIGFVEVNKENEGVLMMKEGDVGGHCC